MKQSMQSNKQLTHAEISGALAWGARCCGWLQGAGQFPLLPWDCLRPGLIGICVWAAELGVVTIDFLLLLCKNRSKKESDKSQELMDVQSIG